MSEVPICVGFLSGVPRQGRAGVGYSTIYGIEVRPAGEPVLTVHDLDRAIDEAEGATGSGSARSGRQLLAELLGRATEQEAEFISRLFTGELRQGGASGQRSHRRLPVAAAIANARLPTRRYGASTSHPWRYRYGVAGDAMTPGLSCKFGPFVVPARLRQLGSGWA